jgi:HEAT repeat protein
MNTYEDVVRILSPIEPTEDMYAAITLEDLPHLQRLSHDPEPWRAARAVFAASRLRGLAANNLVLAATRDPRPELRVAAAASASRLPPAVAEQLLATLLDDHDVGVRKFSIQAIDASSSVALKQKLRTLAANDPNHQLRALAELQARKL